MNGAIERLGTRLMNCQRQNYTEAFVRENSSMYTVTSATAALALLSERDPSLKQLALGALSSLVPQFWAEISEQIPLV